MKNLYAVIFAGLPHVYRDYKDKPVDDVAAEVGDLCAQLEALGVPTGHTPEVEATCRAAWANPDMFYVNDMYWMVYDQQRDDGKIPPPGPEGTWEP